MRCISPILVRSPKHRVFVPCGKCNACLASKRQDWSLRLAKELRWAFSAKFLTLTYSDELIPRNPDTGMSGFCKRDVQLFMKRLRKEAKVFSNFQVRYYLVAEYGTHTFRPHYHAIMFNVPVQVIAKLPQIWLSGHVHIGDVSDASINYVTKYVINRTSSMFEGRDPSFSMMSKRPGIGMPYLEKAMQWHRADDRNYVIHEGVKRKMPRYFRDKVFTKAERARLAKESLEEGDVAYMEELDRLSKLHPDPVSYYDERERSSYESTFKRLNEKDKF